jgi:hypothetical protein
VVVKSGDVIVCVALVLSALAAMLSAPADSSVTYQKLGWLLTQGAAAETITITGAIGRATSFPVSP